MSVNGGQYQELYYFQYKSSSASRRDIICLSWWESFKNILNIFSSSSLPWYTIRGNQKCYYHHYYFPFFFQNLMKVCCVTPGHYGCPFRNINIVLFFIKCMCIIWEIFMTSEIYVCFFKKFYRFRNMKRCIQAYFEIFLFLSRRDARTSLWRYQPI